MAMRHEIWENRKDVDVTAPGSWAEGYDVVFEVDLCLEEQWWSKYSETLISVAYRWMDGWEKTSCCERIRRRRGKKNLRCTIVTIAAARATVPIMPTTCKCELLCGNLRVRPEPTHWSIFDEGRYFWLGWQGPPRVNAQHTLLLFIAVLQLCVHLKHNYNIPRNRGSNGEILGIFLCINRVSDLHDILEI